MWLCCSATVAQDTPPPSDAGVGPERPDGAGAAPAPSDAPPAQAAPPEEPRGDAPLTPEAVVSEEAQRLLEASEAHEPTPAQERAPSGPRAPKPPTRGGPKQPDVKVSAPLVLWASAGWASALGSARCGSNGIEGMEQAIRIASTLKRSVSVAGFGVAPAGLFGDHPLIAHAAHSHPEQLAAWLARAGFAVVSVGIADLRGPLLRDPQLSAALAKHGITVVASNFVCAGRAFCDSWASAEDPLPIIERDGRKYALISLLPDDVLARVEPIGGERVELRPAAEALVERVIESDAKKVDLVVSSLDHGPDTTASVQVAGFLEQLPADKRPELLLSPSTGENLLFIRPLDVQPAVVGARTGVLTGLRVTKLAEQRDADVFARSVRLHDWDDSLAAGLGELGAAYCRERSNPLPGGQLEAPLDADAFLQLSAAAACELADADIALLDPLAYDRHFGAAEGQRLQRGQAERGVVLDSPLVAADVPLDWIGAASKLLEGLRPLTLVGTSKEGGDSLIAGRLPVPNARYRVVTTSVLARSGRLPGGVTFEPLDVPNASLRGALLAHLEVQDARDPRTRRRDPSLGTQWVLRTDGQLLANVTEVDNRGNYEEPALKVNDSRQLGLRLVVNLDADAPKFLFENLLQVAFDRNFASRTTAVDLTFLQTTYTYRGLWPSPLLYPHPFVELYGETAFQRARADDGDPYQHVLLRPKAGVRSMASRVLSLKLFAGFQYEMFAPDRRVNPSVGAEILLKPWTIVTSDGTLQLEGNITYLWDSPGDDDAHTVRGQLISSFQLIGPLQLTLTALGALRKDSDRRLGKGMGMQVGVRLRFVGRTMTD